MNGSLAILKLAFICVFVNFSVSNSGATFKKTIEIIFALLNVQLIADGPECYKIRKCQL